MALRPLYDTGGEGEIVRWYKGKVQRLVEGQERAVIDATEWGAQLMRELIETRGTGRKWEHPWDGRTGSYPGRVHTGNMVDSVSTRFVQGKSGKFQSHFGWINNKDDYFRYQEGGFNHVLAGHHVEGMYALLDASEAAFEYMKEAMSREAKNA